MRCLFRICISWRLYPNNAFSSHWEYERDIPLRPASDLVQSVCNHALQMVQVSVACIVLIRKTLVAILRLYCPKESFERMNAYEAFQGNCFDSCYEHYAKPRPTGKSEPIRYPTINCHKCT
jgi:hypothetical protein